MPARGRHKRTTRTSRAQTNESSDNLENDENKVTDGGQENAEVDDKQEESNKGELPVKSEEHMEDIADTIKNEVDNSSTNKTKEVVEDKEIAETPEILDEEVKDIENKNTFDNENGSNKETKEVVTDKEMGETLLVPNEELKVTKDKNDMIETKETAESVVKESAEEKVNASESKEMITAEKTKEIVHEDENKEVEKSNISDQVDAPESKEEPEAAVNDEDSSKSIIDDKEPREVVDDDSNEQNKSKDAVLESEKDEEIVNHKDNNVMEKESDILKEIETAIEVKEQSSEPEIMIIDDIAPNENTVKHSEQLKNIIEKTKKRYERYIKKRLEDRSKQQDQSVKISQDTFYLTNVEKLLACELCNKMCVLGIVVECCGVQACRSCATKKMRGVKRGAKKDGSWSCWSCKKPGKPKLLNDGDLRSAVNRFQENSHFKTDPVVIAAIKKRKYSRVVKLKEARVVKIKKARVVKLKEAKDLTNDQVKKLLSCELCSSLCFRGVVLPCCGAQACRECALKKVLADRVCWSCKKPTKSENFQNDKDLRAAVNKFNENSNFKTDPEIITAIMARRDKKMKITKKEKKKEKKKRKKNKDTPEKKEELCEKSVAPGKNLKANKRFDKITKEGPMSDRKEVIATINRGPLICFMIPQVMCVNARSVSVDKVGLRYEINQEGFKGQGVIKVFDRTTEVRSVGCMIKMIPESFNKDTLKPHQLATPSGRYPELRKSEIIGSYEGLTEQQLNDIPPNPSITQFKLVFKGPETFKVDGFKCLTAQFADIDDSSRILQGSTEHFYSVCCDHKELNILTAAVSPFTEDDMCVRVIVIPTLKDGVVLKNGDVLGSVELLEENGIFKVKHDLTAYNLIISRIWTDQFNVATHLAKKSFEKQCMIYNGRTGDGRGRSKRSKVSKSKVKRAVLQQEAIKLKSQGVKTMNGKPIDKVIRVNKAYSKGEKKLRKKLQTLSDGKNNADLKKNSINSPSKKRSNNEPNSSAKKKGRWENPSAGRPPPAANPSLMGQSYYDKDVERFGVSGFNQLGSYQMGGTSNYMDENRGGMSGMYGQGSFDYSYANNFGQGGRSDTHYGQYNRSSDFYGQSGRSADNYGGGGRSADNYGGVGTSADYYGGSGRSAKNYRGGRRSPDNYRRGGGSADNNGRGGKSFNPMMGSMNRNRYSGYDNGGPSSQNNYQQQGQGYGNSGISRERQDIENEKRKIEREIMEYRAEINSLIRMKGEVLNHQGSGMQYGGYKGSRNWSRYDK